MATLEELMAQRAALDAQIAQAREAQRKDIIAKVRALVEQYALTVEDVFGRSARASGPAAAPRPAKYRDPETGATWTGRGKPPGWIKGRDREAFLIG